MFINSLGIIKSLYLPGIEKHCCIYKHINLLLCHGSYPSTSDHCWRGCGHRGTLLHLWEDIKAQIKEILGLGIPFSPLHFIFHITPIPVSQFKKSDLLNAARCLLPVYWKHAHVPSHEEWIQKVREIRKQKSRWQLAEVQGNILITYGHCG